jgi:hypothetical protein
MKTFLFNFGSIVVDLLKNLLVKKVLILIINALYLTAFKINFLSQIYSD